MLLWGVLLCGVFLWGVLLCDVLLCGVLLCGVLLCCMLLCKLFQSLFEILIWLLLELWLLIKVLLLISKLVKICCIPVVIGFHCKGLCYLIVIGHSTVIIVVVLARE